MSDSHSNNQRSLWFIVFFLFFALAVGAFFLSQNTIETYEIETTISEIDINPSSTSENQKTISYQEPEKDPEKVFNADVFTLSNGLQVVVIPNHRVPVITHMVWYKVGAADEKAGKSGIAHFLEHLMFKGSEVIGEEPLAPGEFSKKVRALGGRDNAFTSQDYTAYYQSIAKEHLETVMRMEAGRMRGVHLTQEHVDSERQTIIEERRERIDNDPRARFGEQMGNMVFVNHPYGTPIIGWKHEMEGLTHEDALSFYKKWYAPNNAVLVVAGDVTGKEVFDLANEIYGQIPAQPDLPERNWTTSPPFNSQANLVLQDKSIRQPMVQVAFRVPSFSQNKKDSLAFQLLEDIMGGSPASRLYKSLVVEKKIASSASLSYNPNALGGSVLWIYAQPLPEKNPEEVLEILMEEIIKVSQNGISDQELSEAKTRLKNEAIYALDSLDAPARVLGMALTTGAEINDIEYWPREIDKITAEDIQSVAKQYINPADAHDYPPVVGYLLPEIEESSDKND